MKRRTFARSLCRAAGLFALCAGVGILTPGESQGGVLQAEVQTRTSYVVSVEAPSAAVFQKAGGSGAVLGQVRRGQMLEVLDCEMSGGWAKVRAAGRTGYIKVPGNGMLVEMTSESVNQAVRTRREVVEYALQFLGGEYVYGGTDPNEGVDCSGFTRYVLAKAASIDLPHSSSGQAECGMAVTEEEMQPGDLLFYAGEGGINHVAMYIGEGQVVHASTEETGIKTSPYNYREPVKIVSLLS